MDKPASFDSELVKDTENLSGAAAEKSSITEEAPKAPVLKQSQETLQETLQGLKSYKVPADILDTARAWKKVMEDAAAVMAPHQKAAKAALREALAPHFEVWAKVEAEAAAVMAPFHEALKKAEEAGKSTRKALEDIESSSKTFGLGTQKMPDYFPTAAVPRIQSKIVEHTVVFEVRLVKVTENSHDHSLHSVWRKKVLTSFVPVPGVFINLLDDEQDQDHVTVPSYIEYLAAESAYLVQFKMPLSSEAGAEMASLLQDAGWMPGKTNRWLTE